MSQDVTRPEHADLLSSMLKALASMRTEKGAWIDAEDESSGTLVFKLGEGLRPFLLVGTSKALAGVARGHSPAFVLEDSRTFLKIIKRDGYFPSPYSPVESRDQYTDLAAFVIEFCDLVQRHPATSQDRYILRTAPGVKRDALAFLTSNANFVETEEGIRWAGTTTTVLPVKGNAKQDFTNTYFTAVALLALHRTHEANAAAETLDDADLSALIQKAGRWIAGREKGGLLTGDQARTSQQLFYTTWGLRALAVTYDSQEASTQNVAKAVAPAYVDMVASQAREGVRIIQDYVPVCSTELRTALSYEERAAWAGIALCLSSLSGPQEIRAVLDGTNYRAVFDQVLSGLVALREPGRDIWYKDFPIVSIHSYIAELLVGLATAPTSLDYSFEITAGVVARGVREALGDARIVKALEEVLYARLRALADERLKRQQFRVSLATVTSSVDGDSTVPVAGGAPPATVREERLNHPRARTTGIPRQGAAPVAKPRRRKG